MSTILFRDMHGNASLSLLVFVLIYCETCSVLTVYVYHEK
jgi:hypothetical protein